MKKIPPIGWFLLILTALPAIGIITVAIHSTHHDMSERIIYSAGAVSFFLTVVGVLIYARQEEREIRSNSTKPVTQGKVPK